MPGPCWACQAARAMVTLIRPLKPLQPASQRNVYRLWSCLQVGVSPLTPQSALVRPRPCPQLLGAPGQPGVSELLGQAGRVDSDGAWRPGRRCSLRTQLLGLDTRPTLSMSTFYIPALTPFLVLRHVMGAIEVHGHRSGSLDTCPYGVSYSSVVPLD